MTTPLTSVSVTAELRAIIGRRQIQHADLAARANMTPMSLSRRLRGDTRLTVDDLDALCRALDVDVRELLEDVRRHSSIAAERFPSAADVAAERFPAPREAGE